METVEAEDRSPRPLSAKFTSDFAYVTVKDRLPVILTKAIDTLFRMKDSVSKEYGEDGREELKAIIARMSKLRNELQTDKRFLQIEDGISDKNLWNLYLEHKSESMLKNSPSWFGTDWLYAECYFYRRIFESVQHSTKLRHFDPFRQQKEDALLKSMEAVKALAKHLTETIQGLAQSPPDCWMDSFLQILQVNLWGNKCDLSISAGDDNYQTANPITQCDSLRPAILHDDSMRMWRYLAALQDTNSTKRRLDIVLDNAGFELFTDLSLAHLLLTSGYVTEIHLHGKRMPWFVSDVTREDLDWTLEQLCRCAYGDAAAAIGNQCRASLEDVTYVFKQHDFWTLPHDFSQMKDVAPDLYVDLSLSDLILFKGDLNYRKLTGDLLWDPTTAFSTALRGFQPAPLCALRALKSDLITGLKKNVAEETQEKDKSWMITGSYAVIQFCEGRL